MTQPVSLQLRPLQPSTRVALPMSDHSPRVSWHKPNPCQGVCLARNQHWMIPRQCSGPEHVQHRCVLGDKDGPWGISMLQTRLSICSMRKEGWSWTSFKDKPRKISLPCCFLNFWEGKGLTPSCWSKAWHGSSFWGNSESYYYGTSPEQPGLIPACMLLDHFMGIAGR